MAPRQSLTLVNVCFVIFALGLRTDGAEEKVSSRSLRRSLKQAGAGVGAGGIGASLGAGGGGTGASNEGLTAAPASSPSATQDAGLAGVQQDQLASAPTASSDDSGNQAAESLTAAATGNQNSNAANQSPPGFDQQPQVTGSDLTQQEVNQLKASGALSPDGHPLSPQPLPSGFTIISEPQPPSSGDPANPVPSATPPVNFLAMGIDPSG